LDKTAGGAVEACRNGQPHSYRRQQSIEAPLFKPVDLRAGYREVVADLVPGASSRRSIISAPKCSTGTRGRTAVGACCSIPATAAPRRQGGGARPHPLCRIDLGSLPSAASSRNSRRTAAEPESGQGRLNVCFWRLKIQGAVNHPLC
jgi:hypothetical protein